MTEFQNRYKKIDTIIVETTIKEIVYYFIAIKCKQMAT